MLRLTIVHPASVYVRYNPEDLAGPRCGGPKPLLMVCVVAVLVTVCSLVKRVCEFGICWCVRVDGGVTGHM